MRLKLSAAGGEPSAQEVSVMMDGFGYNEAENKYRRDTPVAEVLRAADEFLADVLPSLRTAFMNPFAATVRGDARHYLNTIGK